MPRFAPLLLAAVLASPAAFAQTVGIPLPTSTALQPAPAPRTAGQQELSNFDPGATGLSLYSFSSGGGYVTGTHVNYTEVGTFFTSGGTAYDLQGVSFYGTRAEKPAAPTFTISVFGGQLASGPAGAPLASKTFDVADIRPIEGSTVTRSDFRFDTPVAVPDTFFVLFSFDPNAAPDDAAIVSTPDLDAPNLFTYLNNAGSFVPLQSAIGSAEDPLEIYLYALAVVTPSASTAGEAPAEASLATLDAPRPNPAVRQSVVPFSLAAPATVRLAVLDVLGREVAVLADAPLAGGPHRAMLRTDGLAPGTYVLRLRADGEAVARPFVVAR